MSRLVINLINELHETMVRDDQKNEWVNPGTRALDEAAAVVADYYIQFSTERATIRNEIADIGKLWSLVLFVRRVGLLVATKEGEIWFNRGLAVASMIDSNCDYRDLIVSLVLLRSFASDAGLKTDEAFEAAISWSTERMHDILTNARDHAPSDVQLTVVTFGPRSSAG